MTLNEQLNKEHDPHDGRAGSLVIQAIGDALGFLVEGYGPNVCAPHAERVFSSNWIPAGFGQYSDDTQLARELVLSLNADDIPKEFGRRLADLFETGKAIGYGPSTIAAANRLINGTPWYEAGTPAPAAGDGAAMRAGPVGFLDLPDDDLIRIADDQGRVTHMDMRSRAAGILVALVVADGIRWGTVAMPAIRHQAFPLAPRRYAAAWFERLAQAVESRDPLLASGVRKMPDWLPLDPTTVCAEIRAWSKPPADSPYHFSRWSGISPFATPAVLYALYAYARTPQDPEEVLRVSIAVGGDVDTVAAMAGAMVGAAVGLNGLTPRLQKLAGLLHDQGSYEVDDLIEIARAVK